MKRTTYSQKLGASLFALTMASQAYARTEPTAPTAEGAAADAITDIIVTARRRNESIQSTPIAITAISPARLEGSAAVSISDLQGAAPNVLITQQPAGASSANISIRGISFADVEKSFDPAVGVIVDGVYIGTSTGQLLDFFDIQQIEILRGPQGTLFGRNTIGGVINVRRTRPTGEWGGKFELSYGKYNSFDGRAVVNVPIIEDVLAAKFFYFHHQTDGYLRDYTTRERRGGDNSENFGASFLLTPGSNFDALLTLEKQVDDAEPAVSSLSNDSELICAGAPAIECNRNKTTDLYTVFENRPDRQTYRAPAVTLEANWQTGPVKLTSVTSYRSSKEYRTFDSDASSIDFYNTNRRQSYHQFSQELRGAGNITPRLDYVAGVYYFSSKYNLRQDTSLGPLLTGAPAFIFTPPQIAEGTSSSYAAFADLDWRFADRWRLSVGGRYTRDQKGLANDFLGTPSFPVSNSATFGKFTPKVSVDFRPNDNAMVYASWSKGFRSGGFNGRAATVFSSSFPYKPENVSAYELGLKTDFLNRKLSLNLAGFYTDYKGIQESTTIPTPPGSPNAQETVVSNAASAHIKGFEADLTARPFRDFTLTASLGYTDAKFKRFLINGGTADLSQISLIYAPKLTASINAEYSMQLGGAELKLNAGYRHLSKYDQSIVPDYATASVENGVTVVHQNDPRVQSDTQDLVDASISILPRFMNGKARVTVFGRNLLDDRGTLTSFPVYTLWTFALAREPRTYGVQLGYSF